MFKFVILFIIFSPLVFAYTPTDKVKYDQAVAKAKKDGEFIINTECRKLEAQEQADCIRRVEGIVEEVKAKFRKQYLEKK